MLQGVGRPLGPLLPPWVSAGVNTVMQERVGSPQQAGALHVRSTGAGHVASNPQEKLPALF